MMGFFGVPIATVCIHVYVKRWDLEKVLHPKANNLNQLSVSRNLAPSYLPKNIVSCTLINSPKGTPPNPKPYWDPRSVMTLVQFMTLDSVAGVYFPLIETRTHIWGDVLKPWSQRPMKP